MSPSTKTFKKSFVQSTRHLITRQHCSFNFSTADLLILHHFTPLIVVSPSAQPPSHIQFHCPLIIAHLTTVNASDQFYSTSLLILLFSYFSLFALNWLTHSCTSFKISSYKSQMTLNSNIHLLDNVKAILHIYTYSLLHGQAIAVLSTLEQSLC